MIRNLNKSLKRLNSYNIINKTNNSRFISNIINEASPLFLLSSSLTSTSKLTSTLTSTSMSTSLKFQNRYFSNTISGVDRKEFLNQYIEKAKLNPIEPGIFYCISVAMDRDQTINLFDKTLTVKDVYIKEIENQINSNLYDKVKFTQIMNCLFYDLDSSARETARINNIEYSKLQLACWMYGIDETNQYAINYFLGYLYVHGKSSVTFSNGKKYERSEPVLLRPKFLEEKEILENRFHFDLYIESIEEFIRNKTDCDQISLINDVRGLTFSMKQDETVLIFGEKLNKLQIIARICLELPQTPFINMTFVETQIAHGINKLFKDGSQSDYIDYFIRDIENNENFKIETNHPGYEYYYNLQTGLLQGVYTLMKSFDSTCIINGKTLSKLEILLKWYEFSHFKQPAEKLLLLYAEHLGLVSFKLQSGKTLKYNPKNKSFSLI